MKVLRATAAGVTRAITSPGVVAVVWMMTVVAALPLVIVMEEAIRTDLGASQIHEELRGTLDLGWLEEFQHRNPALGSLLTPGRLSGTLGIENMELLLSGEWLTENRRLAATAGIFIVFWILVQGGVIAHLVDPESRFRPGGFLRDSGSFFFRFLRLAVMLGVGYYGIYRLAFWLFPAIERWTRDVTVEKTALAAHLLGGLLIVLLMTSIHLVSDYAKIATVYENRRSMMFAVGHSLVQVVKHPLQAFGPIGLFFMIGASLQSLLFLMLPDVRNATLQAAILAFILGQMYLVVRSMLRVARFAAEIGIYRQWRSR